MWLLSNALRWSNIRQRLGHTIALGVGLLLPIALINAQEAQPETNVQWQQTLTKAEGETVYFYAWGGSKPVNDYLRWASKEISRRYKIRLQHVKVADISEAVSRLKAEDGSQSAIDLVWINGENFSYLKEQHLLLGNLWAQIPNTAQLATQKLSLDSDFGVSMEGYEVPWGVGQFNLIANQDVFTQNMITPHSLLTAAKQYPGQVSYPRPPEFHGTTFLKQLLVALSHNDKRLFAPATVTAQDELLPLMWAYLDQLHALSWQQGRAFPSSNTEQMALFAQQQLVMAVSFNPNQITKEQAAKRIPNTTQRLFFAQGAITNSHNLAIPKGAQSPDGAKVVINFLLSEQAQRQKLTGSWGDPAVITPLLDETSTLPAQQELHSSWQQIIEDRWQQKYGA